MTLTFSHLSAETFESSLKAGRKRPRVREALSCWQCRVRKTRCNRRLPCDQCKDRDPADCCYGAPPDDSLRLRSRSGKHSSPPQTGPVSPPSLGQSPVSRTSPKPNPAGSDTTVNAFQLKGFKSRLIGISHWMAPSRDVPVIKAMLEHPAFESSRRQFNELKSHLQDQYQQPAPRWINMEDGSAVRMLLPDRQTCETWTTRFCQTYNRIYGIIDPVLVAAELVKIYDGTLNNPVHISRLLLVTAIGMQDSDSERTRGRILASHVENCIHSRLKFQKPCIGAVQNLLLLMVMKTISSSDTDRVYNMMVLQGLTGQILSSMGLHRDPSLFPGITPYGAEVRKRLWACFLRLSLEYSMRSGSQFNTRLDETDCPLPSPVSLRSLEGCPVKAGESTEEDVTDAQFAIAAVKLVTVIAPAYRGLFLPEPPDTRALRDKMTASFSALTAELPPHLRSEASNPVSHLQCSILVATMQGFLTVLTFAFPGVPERSQLMETWDYASSVMHQFQDLCEKHPNLRNIACHLLWADVSRAALAGSATVSKLRQDGCGLAMHPQQTVRVFQQLLAQSLTFLSEFWQGRFHLGPVAAKVNLILAVLSSAVSDLCAGGTLADGALVENSAMAAEKEVAKMKLDLQRHLPTLTPASTEVFSPAMMGTFPLWNAAPASDPTVALLDAGFGDFDFDFSTGDPGSAALLDFGFGGDGLVDTSSPQAMQGGFTALWE